MDQLVGRVELQLVLVAPDWFGISTPGLDQITKCTGRLRQEDQHCGSGLMGDLLVAEISQRSFPSTHFALAAW